MGIAFAISKISMKSNIVESFVIRSCKENRQNKESKIKQWLIQKPFFQLNRVWNGRITLRQIYLFM